MNIHDIIDSNLKYFIHIKAFHMFLCEGLEYYNSTLHDITNKLKL